MKILTELGLLLLVTPVLLLFILVYAFCRVVDCILTGAYFLLEIVEDFGEFLGNTGMKICELGDTDE